MKTKPNKPAEGDIKTYPGIDGDDAIKVKFNKDNVSIIRTGAPDVTRTIVPKYGNIRKVDGQLKQIADDVLWYLFNLTDSN